LSVVLYSLFTLPTRARQNCLVLSCSCRRCEHNCRQDKFRWVLSRLDPVSNLQLFNVMHQGLLKTWKLETGSRQQNCLVLSQIVFTPPTQARQEDSLVRIGSVNKLLEILDKFEVWCLLKYNRHIAW